MTAWYDDEEGFASELDRGRVDELRVAIRILPLGLWVRVGEYWFRDGKAGDDPRCADQRDIEVEGNHLLEVKGRRFAFTGPDDYPYPTAFVGATRRWEEREDIPCAVVLLSEPTDKVVATGIRDRPSWVVESSLDHRRGFVENSFAVPCELLRTEAQLLEHLSQPCPYRVAS